MKLTYSAWTNNNLQDQYGVGGSETTYAPAWAQYFVKYINAFKNLGVTINAITLQNEPTNSKAGFPTMYMFPDEQGLLMQWYLGPALQNASLNTSMWGGEVNTGRLIPIRDFEVSS